MLVQYDEALCDIRTGVLNIVKDLALVNKESLSAIESRDGKRLSTVGMPLGQISQRAEKVDNDIVRLFAKYTPEARDLREMVSYLKITTALDRIRSNINNYLNSMQNVIEEENARTEAIVEHSLCINRCTVKAFDATLEMLKTFDDKDKVHDLAIRIEVEYEKTDDIYRLLEKEVLQYISTEPQQAEAYFNLLKQIRKNLKIIDRLESVAQRIIFARVGGKL